MPDPCSGDLDAVMLGETLSLQACRQAVGQAAVLETWTNGSDIGPQGDQWRLDSRQGLVAMDGGMWPGEGGFRAKFKMGQAGHYLRCWPVRATKHIRKYSKMEKTVLTNVYREGFIPTWKDNLEATWSRR